MRDLLESNVISIGSSSAPGKSACGFLLLPSRHAGACGSLCREPSSIPALGLQLFPSAGARNENLVLLSFHFTASPTAQEKWDSVVLPRASARLRSWSASSGDTATSWQRGPEGLVADVGVSQVPRVGQRPWWLREPLCQATPGHCALGREIIS